MLRVNLIRLQRNISYLSISSKEFCSTHAEITSQVPQYPPILDISRNAKRERENEAWYTQIQNVKTVEEKIIKLNMPRYYGFKVIMINNETAPYNSFPLVKHYTRTHFIEQDKLPDFYQQNDEKASQYVTLIKDDIEKAVAFAYKGYNEEGIQKNQDLTPSEKENEEAALVIYHINRVLLNRLSADENHLFDGEVDYKPRHEAYWAVGGIPPWTNLRKRKLSIKFLKDEADTFVNRFVQYLGKPLLTIRSEQPLQPFVSVDSCSKDVYEVPHFKYDPKVVGLNEEYRHATNIPGFWTGDKHEFGLLSYHARGDMFSRLAKLDAQENQEALHYKGIIHSFSWLMAQANYQGFNTYNDVTYPFTTQTIITNGRKFSFYTYQLNTTTIYGNNYVNNDKVNLCWGTKELNLFESINDEGKLINFNENVLKHLIHFYINQPKDRGINLKPYLDHEKPHIANIEDEEKRVWLEQRYKHLVSNRPRHLLPYEVYHWEKIYKIDHKTRPMDKKRRPFEFKINPYNRRLDEHTPEYIPKCKRPGGPKSKPKWAKTYYP